MRKGLKKMTDDKRKSSILAVCNKLGLPPDEDECPYEADTTEETDTTKPFLICLCVCCVLAMVKSLLQVKNCRRSAKVESLDLSKSGSFGRLKSGSDKLLKSSRSQVSQSMLIR